MREQSAGLPEGWARVRYSDLGSWSGGGTPSKANPEYWTCGRIPWVSPKDMKGEWIHDSEDHITDDAFRRSAVKLIPSGSVLLVTRSGILEHTLPVAVTKVVVTVNQDLKALTPAAGVLAEFAAWAARASAPDILRDCSRDGTTVASIDTARLMGFELPLAPFPEQHRIVAAIESYVSRLDAAVSTLARVQQNLERYRASVLKAAVEGRLVSTEAELARAQRRDYEPASELLKRILAEQRHRWEESGRRGKYEQPALPDTSGLPELPEGWCWASPAQLAATEKHSLGIGPFGSDLKVSDYREVGVPLVFVRNIRKERFGGQDTKFISSEKAEELSAHVVRGGDLLITKMGEPPGDACVYPASYPEAVITADCIRWRLHSLLKSADYFVAALRSNLVRSQIISITKGVAQKKVSVARFKATAIPLPPLVEQRRIADEVARRLSVEDKVNNEGRKQVNRLARLRQSILMWAFEGRLVDQDPNDEPASMLLERIKAERAAARPSSNRRRPRGRARKVS